jgi:hypothetical protein
MNSASDLFRARYPAPCHQPGFVDWPTLRRLLQVGDAQALPFWLRVGVRDDDFHKKSLFGS